MKKEVATFATSMPTHASVSKCFTLSKHKSLRAEQLHDFWHLHGKVSGQVGESDDCLKLALPLTRNRRTAREQTKVSFRATVISGSEAATCYALA